MSCIANFVLKVNQNGILSFERSIIERPSPFPADDIVAIAPFWSEIDFSERDQIYYKESSQWCLLEKAHRLVQFSFTSVWNFFPTHIFTATWMIFEPKIQNQVTCTVLVRKSYSVLCVTRLIFYIQKTSQICCT